MGEPRRGEITYEHESTPRVARRRLWSVRDHQLRKREHARGSALPSPPVRSGRKRHLHLRPSRGNHSDPRHRRRADPAGAPGLLGSSGSLPEARTAYQRRHRQRDLSVDLRIRPTSAHRRSRRSGDGIAHGYGWALRLRPLQPFPVVADREALWLSGYVRERRGGTFDYPARPKPCSKGPLTGALSFVQRRGEQALRREHRLPGRRRPRVSRSRLQPPATCRRLRLSKRRAGGRSRCDGSPRRR